MVKTFRKEEEVFLKGIVKWVKHLKPDMTFPPGKWGLQLYPEVADLERIRMWQSEGIRNKLSFDKEENAWFINLSRKVSLTTKQGKVVGLDPPFVFRMDGEHKIPILEPVGNGSSGVAKCQLWTFNPQPGISGKALRWESLRIDNLIPYKMEEAFPRYEEQTENMDKQEPLF